jgi:putative transposase
MASLDIKKGALIQHPKGLCRFVRWKAFNVLVFETEHGGEEVKLPEHKFNEMHALRQIRLVEQDADGNPIEIREFGPDECWTDSGDPEQAKLTPEGRGALARQFYTRKWDEEGNGSLGDVGLQKLINRWRPVVFQLGYETNEIENGNAEPYRVKVARLRHCIKHCGRPGARPLEAFRDNRGKNSKRRLADGVEDEILKAIDYYYGARPRDYNDAYGYLREAIKKLNEKLPEEKQFKYPRPEVLRRRIDKALTFDNWARKTTRSEAWRKIHGHREHISAERPLELAIIDTTPLDVCVLDSKLLLPLGRPYLTVCLDVYSRMLLGFFITFEPPSLYSVLATLKRVNRHKGYVQKLYPQIKRPWDGWGCPTEILLDRDWAHQSPSFQHSMSNLGTEVHYTRRPLSATVTLAIAEDIAAGLGRLVKRAGCPQEIWLDHAYDVKFGPLETWAERHRISITYGSSLRTRGLSERPLRDLSAFLRGKSVPSLMELGHDVERWRQSYTATAHIIPKANE